MNRVRRDYCSQDRHPAWKAWEARYGVTGHCWDMNNRYPVTNGHMGNHCEFCDTKVAGIAWGKYRSFGEWIKDYG